MVNRWIQRLRTKPPQHLVYFALITVGICFCVIGITNHNNGLQDVDYEELTELQFDFQGDEVEEMCSASAPPKTILFWNKYFGSSNFNFGLGQRPFDEADCSCSRCQLTSDRTMLKQSDAIIFHADDINATDLPTERLPHQRWIFYTFTPPLYFGRLPEIVNNKFNWTMTYRHDSDIINRYPFGSMSPTKKKQAHYGFAPSNSELLKSSFNRKKKFMAYMKTGECGDPDLADSILAELGKYIKIDIYDKCKKKKTNCGTEDECNKMLHMDYKFVLAVEPSLCPDYVGDQLYNKLLTGAIPVIYGQKDYGAFAPPNSFINAADFDSFQEIAEYLMMIGSKEGLYIKYLAWTRDYEIDRWPRTGWCQLCEKLNQAVTPQVYSDISSWWVDNAFCGLAHPHL